MTSKILICTQKVDINDPVLGFFHDWIKQFSNNYQEVTVICLQKGEYSLPDNVKVFSLGKENGVGRIRYLINFYKAIYKQKNNYQTVFVHMNQIYVLLGFMFWFTQKKRIYLWYAHSSVSLTLRIAEKFVEKIFTPTANSLTLNTPKKVVTGHGISTDRFPFVDREHKNDTTFVTVGRISLIKGYEFLIRTLQKIYGFGFKLIIVGGPITKQDKDYSDFIQQMVSSMGLSNSVEFTGPISNFNINQLLAKFSYFVSNSNTGSLDKAILEAMSTGCIPLVCSKGNGEALGIYSDLLHFNSGDVKSLENTILKIQNLSPQEKKDISVYLSRHVLQNHSLENLIKKLGKEML